jgi:flagellar hook-basal body complex protein FliE
VNVDAIGPLPPEPLTGAWPRTAVSPDAPSKFGAWFSEQLGEVNGKLKHADAELQRLAAGDVESLHRVMIDLEEARLSFQLLMQVRNRALEAYQEIIRMQI